LTAIAPFLGAAPAAPTTPGSSPTPWHLSEIMDLARVDGRRRGGQ